MPTTRSTRSRWALPWGSIADAAPGPPSDDDLLLDVGSGDEQAFVTLSDHLAGLVYANIHRALRDPTGTDAVVEEALIEVWQQAARYDPARTPAVIWVLDLAHQLATERDQRDEGGCDGSSVAGGPDAAPGRG